MTRILQIATGHRTLRADYRGDSPLDVLLWALIEDEKSTRLVGMVMDPHSNQIVQADDIEGFRGYLA